MFRATLTCILLALVFCPTTRAAADRPNFILFLADDISWDEFGCYGHPTIKTPHIDHLAARGLRFTNAYLTTSSCSPSRCSIITGRYPHNTGAPELHTSLPAGRPRVAHFASCRASVISRTVERRRLLHRVVGQTSHGQKRKSGVQQDLQRERTRQRGRLGSIAEGSAKGQTVLLLVRLDRCTSRMVDQ